MEPIVRMALAGRHERITAERARQLGILQRGRRPARAAARARPSELAEQDRPQLARRPWPPPSGPCGARSRWASPTPAGRERRELVGMWGHPDQAEGPRAFTEKREPQWQQTYEHLIVERHGPVGWLDLQPARPAQRHEQPDARRVRRRLEGARRRPRRCGSSSTPARAGPSRPASTWPRSPATASACSATASRVEDWDLHFTAWHQEVWKPVITAVNGICAGGGVPLDRRRRHRDRRLRRPVLRSPRVDRPGGGDRGDRPDAQDAGRGRDAHGARRPPRAHVGAAGLRARA